MLSLLAALQDSVGVVLEESGRSVGFYILIAVVVVAAGYGVYRYLKRSRPYKYTPPKP